MLNEKLQKQIEQEANYITAGFQNNDDYESGIIQGYKEGYEDAGDKYANKWQAAESKVERYEKALREIAAHTGGLIPQKHEMIAIAREAIQQWNGKEVGDESK